MDRISELYSKEWTKSWDYKKEWTKSSNIVTIGGLAEDREPWPTLITDVSITKPP